MVLTSRVSFASAYMRPRMRILVPVLIGQMARPVISVGDALAVSAGASGTLLALVEIRTGRDNEVFAQEQRRRDMLRWVAGLEYDSDVRRRLRLSLRMTANPASSVRDVAAENEVTSMLLEWPTVDNPRRHGLIDLTRQLVTDHRFDLMFVRASPRAPAQAIAPRSILVSIRGGPSARVVASTGARLADAFGSSLTLLHVQTDTQHPDRSRREWDGFEQIVDELRRPSTQVRVVRHDSPAAGILEESIGHDLIVIGSRFNQSRASALLGREIDRMLRRVDIPVVMVRAKAVTPVRSNRAANGSDR
ncbi:MAG TPA: universal stress protein [Candidatus Dormibacteraeota bacterium]|nr:universal stress protein [Candidatus Dormibacteraeota bacterium]